MSLSSLIVSREIATIREVEEALARQVLYGGDLVTNLLEVSRLDEGALMAVVAESFGLPVAPAGELPAPVGDAKKVVAGEVAALHAFVPLSMDRYGLTVAVAEPLSREAEQELAFALALPLEQKIAPLVRIRQGLARDFGIALDRRSTRLLARLSGHYVSGGSSLPPARVVRPVAVVKAPPRPPSIIPAPPIKPSFGSIPPPRATTPSSLLRKSEVPPPRPPRRRRGPLTADVARAELEEASERDAILEIVFEYARQFFDYTALFLVHGGIAEGRDAFGDGTSRDKLVRVGVPLDMPSLLSEAREKRSIVRRVPASDGLDPVLMGDLGRGGATDCVVFPVVVRTRVVAMILGDGGGAGIDNATVTDIQKSVVQAAAAFERLIVRRKMTGSIAPPPVGASPSHMPPPARESDKFVEPAIEELAPPIRELAAEPIAPAPPSSSSALTPRTLPEELESLPAIEVPDDTPRRLPPVESAPTAAEEIPSSRPAALPVPSSRPTSSAPAHLLAVRRPSGPPIPREDPESAKRMPVARIVTIPMEAPQLKIDIEVVPPPAPLPEVASVPAPQPRAPTPPPPPPPAPVVVAPPSEIVASHQPRSRRRAEAPSFEFASSSRSGPADSISDSFRMDAAVRRASVTRSSPPITQSSPIAGDVMPSSPRAKSEPPPPPTPSPARLEITDLSPPFLSFPEAVTPVTVAAVSEPPISSGPATDPERDSGELLEPDAFELVPIPVSAEPSRVPMPASEQQISVAAHRPPSSRSDHTRVLPSVIVDVGTEYVALVERVIDGPDDEAETALVRAGSYAMPTIMAFFPGPISVEEGRLATSPLPRVAECGPVLRLIASQRRSALPFVLAKVDDADPEQRFWATYLLSELAYPDAIDAVLRRIVDEDEKVRRAARAATRAFAEAHPAVIVSSLEEFATNERLPANTRVHVIEALGLSREPQAVPVLVALLDANDADIASASRAALVTLTRQDLGTDSSAWTTWWDANYQRHRLEWLIDALMHEHAAVRSAASEELKVITKEYFGYYDDLPKRERERAQARYREWWTNIGRIRFSRSRSS